MFDKGLFQGPFLRFRTVIKLKFHPPSYATAGYISKKGNRHLVVYLDDRTLTGHHTTIVPFLREGTEPHGGRVRA
ncbi:hypothetical protein THTE_0178 [Thermogutta terrifontis]|uniref:Uncharacterized protein n=1 Tax=Thermogutta terrifontis TaxID=1331910 RepID=A0A286RA02_9BACT|nr:hypothetical protein THTE_0178 [Thermogutta terrifontis]